MEDFDMSKDYRLAGSILFMVAAVGLVSNLAVVSFLKSMPSLNNTFGSLTLSQAVVDSIHQLLFTVYVAPTIFLQNNWLYAISDQVGYVVLTAYQICCYSHLCISANRFVAVCIPLTYQRIFSEQRTRKLIIICWLLGITHITFIIKSMGCSLFLPERSWIWSSTETPSCSMIMWYGDFLPNSFLVIIVASLDIAAIARLHCITAQNTDANSGPRKKGLKNLTYQAALQGICFITELLTFFILSSFARNKWELFLLTSVAWCLVNGMDGITVLVCNKDFRWKIIKLLGRAMNEIQFGTNLLTETSHLLIFLMFFVNYISRNDTDRFVPMFEIIYGFEIFFIAITFLVGLSIEYLAYNASKLHRLVRLRINFSILVALLHYASRFAVMNHQYFGPSQYVETKSLIIGSLTKQFFMGYMVTLTSIISLDRFVATKAWAWYESGANSTLFFFALQETIIFLISFTLAYLLVYDHISSMTTVVCFGVLIVFGAIFFLLVFRHNIKVMQKLKRGAQIHRYSVSQTYQIKDNISILTAYFKISKPLVIVCLPPLVLYPTFYLVPPNIGFDGLRFLSAAIFDLWLPIGATTIICCIPRYFPQLKRSLSRKSKRSSIVSIASIDKNMIESGNIYFTMLSNDWK